MNNPIVVGLVVGICVYAYRHMSKVDDKEIEKPTIPILAGCVAWLLMCLYNDFGPRSTNRGIVVTSSPYDGRTYRLSDGRRFSGVSSLNWGGW